MSQTDPTIRKLEPEALRQVCSADFFEAQTQEPCRATGIIGQKRAVRSVQFGLEVPSPGYNIFITGVTGTGKSTYARAAVNAKAKDKETPADWCYLYNFSEPESPKAISLPPGQGVVFRDDMKEFVEDARTAITHEFEGGDYEKQRAQIAEKFQKGINRTFEELEKEVRSKGFALQRSSGGFAPVPLDDEGNPITAEDFAKLDEEKRREIESKGTEIQRDIRSAMREVRQYEKETKSAIRELEKRMGSFAIRPLIEQLQEKYEGFPDIQEYLENVHEDIIGQLERFKTGEDEGPQAQGAQLQLALLGGGSQDDQFKRYQVNLFVNHAETQGAPAVEETNPTYYNLFGKMEYQATMGQMSTDHTMIRPGAVHLANGGYLILRAEDVLMNALSWDALKRSLKGNQIRIENIGEQYRLVPTATIKPEPIPLDVKVILIGSPLIYHLLYAYDPDFAKYFKVKADFDTQMDRNEDYLNQYCRFVQAVVEREQLLPFESSAIAAIVDHGSRLTEDQKKLSARFNEVVEIVYESDAWARFDDAESVTSDHVEKAVEEKIYRSSMIEDHTREAISRRKILVSTEGKAIGQVNGLSVISVGNYAFGRPSRITANTYLGNAGVVNIERQVKLSGTSHSKGVLILSGYLAEQFAHDKPLSVSASITFEQTYGGVDGDSASSAELYALLSSLSGVPLKQSIAVTGSVNQKGELQPIGGVNYKIEGFYYTCKARGLTGDQGVLIPKQNVDNLMLNQEVITAVENGDFHIWAADDIRTGIELMTGVPTGEKDEEGQYPEDTVFGKVDRELRRMAETLRHFGRKSKDEQENTGDSSTTEE